MPCYRPALGSDSAGMLRERQEGVFEEIMARIWSGTGKGLFNFGGTRINRFAAVACVILVVSFVPKSSAWSTPVEASGGESSACSALAQMDWSAVQDAPTQVLRTEIVEASEKSPSFCRVEAYVYPEVGVEVHLPQAKEWNGKLIVTGNGGWAGMLNGESCDQHLKRGYACLTSDTGHRGRGDDGLWALNNLAAQVDFGYRAIHVATLAAKAILGHYYTREAQRAYFMSCSTGGYQGLVEAQRFPWDFDGIIAGAPDMDEADLTMREVWAQRSLYDGNGKAILDTGAMALLHQAALDQCDKEDGVKDGLISNPLECSFDPAKILCKAGQSQGCLSASQVEAARRIYQGPPHARERAIRGALPGSEMGWEFGTNTQYTDSLFEYMIYGASPRWTSASYDFEHDYKRLGMAVLYTDTNPDLRRFKAAGGKLIVYQGANDVVEMPTAIVDYYETVQKVMGGLESTQEFFRLFVIPGMNHCGGGDGASSIDYLSYLETWVEHNQRPDRMIGSHNNPKGETTFTRPTYPYPKFAKYAAGDPNEATSFIPAEPR